MGLIPGTVVTYVKAAPMGDPIEYRIWDYELTLRMSEKADKNCKSRGRQTEGTKAEEPEYEGIASSGPWRDGESIT